VKPITFELPHMRIESQNVGLRASTSPKHVAAMRRRRFALQGKVKRQRLAANLGAQGRVDVDAARAAARGRPRGGHADAHRPGTLDREDNLTAGFKAVRDGIADALALNDRDARLRWHYEQVKHGRGVYGVKVHLEGLSVEAYAERLAARERAA
jgi:hypothetical protein